MLSLKSPLSQEQKETLLATLKARFHSNKALHPTLIWDPIQTRLEQSPNALVALYHMELTGGEPDVVEEDTKTDTFLFMDCSKESPMGRRSLCYDGEALRSRKNYLPESSVIDRAKEMGINVMSEMMYKHLQAKKTVDQKTSSWIETPDQIRQLGGALFGDYRYGHVFIYHNGADSYYASRGFRGYLRV